MKNISNSNIPISINDDNERSVIIGYKQADDTPTFKMPHPFLPNITFVIEAHIMIESLTRGDSTVINEIKKITSNLKELNPRSVRIIKATLVIFVALLLFSLTAMLLPDLFENSEFTSIFYIDTVLSTSNRLLTLGIMIAFIYDLATRNLNKS
ncbi:MAG: hypothetical protein LBL82_01980 [Oscillospiraceae bacterium]|nr:hypothetical protein [Oscillospiraceae bacterium]